MDTLIIFLTQFAMSLLVWGLVARALAFPWLQTLSLRVALSLLLIPHALRHLGLTFFVPGVVADGMPDFFASSAGYGDLLSAVLAIAALLAVNYRWTGALALVWLFNAVGIADLVNALRQAEAVPHFGAAWFIPTFWVPILLATHGLMIALLWRARGEPGGARSA